MAKKYPVKTRISKQTAFAGKMRALRKALPMKMKKVNYGK
jgi:hypothetical protein